MNVRESLINRINTFRFILILISTLLLLANSDPVSIEAAEKSSGDSAYETQSDRETLEEDNNDNVIEEGEEEEEEEIGVETPHTGRWLYTSDISDEMLEKLFSEDPSRLGSISVGYPSLGRLINGVKFPEGDAWVIVNPSHSYATQEVIDYLITAAKAVKERFPDAPPLRINDLSAPRGGYIRPHKSHQNGRDVDIGFYYISDPKNPRAKIFDLAKNWEFIKAVITKTDVQLILVDRRIQKKLYDYAKEIGENEEWLNSIFKSDKDSLIKHARRHRGHFHIRFYSPRAQELGKRIHPLLDRAKEEERIALHKVKRGECLGKIAMKYNSSVALIKKANHLKSNNIKAGMTLFIPLLGPCHNCPEPPDVVIPERRTVENLFTMRKRLAIERVNSSPIPINYYFELYPFTRINSFWLKLDKY